MDRYKYATSEGAKSLYVPTEYDLEMMDAAGLKKMYARNMEFIRILAEELLPDGSRMEYANIVCDDMKYQP